VAPGTIIAISKFHASRQQWMLSTAYPQGQKVVHSLSTAAALLRQCKTLASAKL